MNIPQISNIAINKLYIKKHYPDFYEYLLERYKDFKYNKFSELLYCYKNNIDIHPTCPICGKDVPFLDFNRGYQKYCSLKCSNLSPEVQEKKKQTNLKNYGVEYASQSDEVKEKSKQVCIERYGGVGNASESTKTKQHKTMEEKYGSKHALQNNELKEKAINTTKERYGGIGLSSDILKEKAINTIKERYGVEFSLQTDEIREKIKNTNLERYGTCNPTENEIIKNKIKQSKHDKLIANNENIINTEISEDGDIMYIIKCPHPNCNKCADRCFKIRASYYQRRLYDGTEICTNLLPVQKSISKNTSLEIFIKNILDEYNISYIENDRTILNGKEIDIYIPDKKIGIECNGIYWHSLKDPNYHINKWKQCKENGVQLLTIWQDWIINKPEIIKSIILSKLGIYKRRIYARKCIVKELSQIECNNFLNKNHIQGVGKSIIRLGLYYNNELVSVMTFCNENRYNKNFKIKDCYYDLNRFCNSINTQVIGGAGKLLKYFINKYHPITIASFASNDISNGGLYKSLNFQEETINKSYWYVDKEYKRYHHSSFTRSIIIKKGWNEKELKEKDIMYKHGYFQIYDSGQTKYLLY